MVEILSVELITSGLIFDVAAEYESAPHSSLHPSSAAIRARLSLLFCRSGLNSSFFLSFLFVSFSPFCLEIIFPNLLSAGCDLVWRDDPFPTWSTMIMLCAFYDFLFGEIKPVVLITPHLRSISLFFNVSLNSSLFLNIYVTESNVLWFSFITDRCCSFFVDFIFNPFAKIEGMSGGYEEPFPTWSTKII